MKPIPPHLSKCPRHGGLPVPAVVATLKGHIGLEECRRGDFTHQTAWVPEGTDPDFGSYDEEKHRQCMERRYCHVCTRVPNPMLICLPKHRKPESEQTIRIGGARGRMVPLVKQPWVCVECLAYACGVCPPLRKAIEEGRGLVAYVDEAVLVATQWKPAGPEDPKPPEGARVLSNLKVALVRARYVPLGEWVSRFTAPPSAAVPAASGAPEAASNQAGPAQSTPSSPPPSGRRAGRPAF